VTPRSGANRLCAYLSKTCLRGHDWKLSMKAHNTRIGCAMSGGYLRTPAGTLDARAGFTLRQVGRFGGDTLLEQSGEIFSLEGIRAQDAS
jgi:hypothetical protein